MKYLILSFSILWTVGCSESIPLEATDSSTPEDLVSHSEEFRLTMTNLIGQWVSI